MLISSSVIEVTKIEKKAKEILLKDPEKWEFCSFLLLQVINIEGLKFIGPRIIILFYFLLFSVKFCYIMQEE